MKQPRVPAVRKMMRDFARKHSICTQCFYRYSDGGDVLSCTSCRESKARARAKKLKEDPGWFKRKGREYYLRNREELLKKCKQYKIDKDIIDPGCMKREYKAYHKKKKRGGKL